MIVALLLALAVPAPVLDPGTVQDITLVEINTGLDAKDKRFCKSAVDPSCTTISRSYRLKDEWRTRALNLINEARFTPAKSPACPGPRHAIVVETTQGKRAFEWNFECRTANKPAAREAWLAFFRSFGLVQHMPPVREK